MIGKAIYARLSAATTGPLVGDRIEASIDTTRTAPFVAWEVTEEYVDETYNTTGPTRCRVTVSAVAADITTADIVAAAIVADLHNQDGTWGGIVVLGAWKEGGDTQAVQLDTGGSQQLFVKDGDFLIIAR